LDSPTTQLRSAVALRGQAEKGIVPFSDRRGCLSEASSAAAEKGDEGTALKT